MMMAVMARVVAPITHPLHIASWPHVIARIHTTCIPSRHSWLQAMHAVIYLSCQYTIPATDIAPEVIDRTAAEMIPVRDAVGLA